MAKVPAEVVFESYALKATFFYEKLMGLGFFGLYSKISDMINAGGGTAYSWESKANWDISIKAWDAIIKADVEPLFIFCHPKVLITHPSFLKYYRSVALLPLKGLSAISGYSSIEKIENGEKEIPAERIESIVKSINSVVSLVIEMSEDIDNEIIKGMMFSTAGTTIEGSWRNRIGAEGERVVRTIIAQSFIENKELIAYSDRKDRTISVTGDDDLHNITSKIANIKTLTLKNGTTVLFSSEPDVQLMDSEGKTIGAVEVKAGLDPAGALERLGAMFKSFDSILARFPDAETILVASCITDEVQARLNAAKSVGQTFILTDIISKKRDADKVFTNRVRSILGLTESRL